MTIFFRLETRQRPCGKFLKTFFGERLNFAKNFDYFERRPFFLENSCPVVSWSLTSRIPVLGLKKVCPWQRWSRGHKVRGQGQADTKKIRGQGQGQPFRGQTLLRPRTGMLEAKNQGHRRKCSPKKKVFKNFF